MAQKDPTLITPDQTEKLHAVSELAKDGTLSELLGVSSDKPRTKILEVCRNNTYTAVVNIVPWPNKQIPVIIIQQKTPELNDVADLEEFIKNMQTLVTALSATPQMGRPHLIFQASPDAADPKLIELMETLSTSPEINGLVSIINDCDMQLYLDVTTAIKYRAMLQILAAPTKRLIQEVEPRLYWSQILHNFLDNDPSSSTAET